MNVLVVGGAGYIGSHMVKRLVGEGHSVWVLDNHSTGGRVALPFGTLVNGDLADAPLLDQLFQAHAFQAVLHFAAHSLVGESVTSPSKYYQNNVVNTLNLLDAMCRHQVSNLIFSSTAAVFGNPNYTPIDEQHPTAPINPYGASKWMVERILQDYANAYGLNSVALRYFNACGADPDVQLGEWHEPETHLIPLVLQTALGKRDAITVFGRDYPTPDGTCIRDYIHVEDLCTAHALALDHLVSGKLSGACAFNLGNGSGFSVQQVVAAAQKVVGQDGYTITIQEGERRAGDPAVLVADARLAQQVLGWRSQYAELQTIIEHAWAWEKKRWLVG